jgi:hypothetical protein
MLHTHVSFGDGTIAELLTDVCEPRSSVITVIRLRTGRQENRGSFTCGGQRFFSSPPRPDRFNYHPAFCPMSAGRRSCWIVTPTIRLQLTSTIRLNLTPSIRLHLTSTIYLQLTPIFRPKLTSTIRLHLTPKKRNIGSEGSQWAMMPNLS